MSNRSEQPQRVKGGLHEAIRQGVPPTSTSKETKEFIKAFEFSSMIRCPRCAQHDIEVSWGEELVDKPGWFERVAACNTCHLTWPCAFMVRSAIETSFESKKEGG